MILYTELDSIFERFNQMFEDLLGDKLDRDEIVFTLQRKNKVIGCLIHNSFENTNGSFKHEILLNPEYFTVKPKIEILRVFCQELLKLYRIKFGDKETLNIDMYDADWGAYMLIVGLIPTHNGKPEGRDTGKKMSSYFEHDGPFLNLCTEMAEEGLLIEWFDKIPSKYDIDNLMADLYELNEVVMLTDIHPLLAEVPILKRKSLDVMALIGCLSLNEESKKVELNTEKARETLVVNLEVPVEEEFNEDLPVDPKVAQINENSAPSKTESERTDKELVDVMLDRKEIPVLASVKKPATHKGLEDDYVLPKTLNISSKDQIAEIIGFEKPKPPSVRRSSFKYKCGCGNEVTGAKENMRFTCNSCNMGFICETETYETGVAESI